MKLPKDRCEATTTTRHGHRQCKNNAKKDGLCGHHSPGATKRRKDATKILDENRRYNSTQGRLDRMKGRYESVSKELWAWRSETMKVRDLLSKKGQSKTMSAVENVCSVASGFVVAMLLWRFVVTPYLGIPVSYGTNVTVVALFTAASIIRGYIWRRVFNGAWRK